VIDNVVRSRTFRHARGAVGEVGVELEPGFVSGVSRLAFPGRPT